MINLRSTFIFFRCLFSYIFGIHTPSQIAFASLTGKSFRVPQKDVTSLRFVFFIFKDTLQKIVKATIPANVDKEEKSAIFDLNAASYQLRKDYIQAFHADSQIKKGFFKNELLHYYYSPFQKLMDAFLFCFLYFLLLPFAIFSSRRASIALIAVEVIESIQLIRHLKNNNVKTVYFFCIYEKDANFAALLLKAFHIVCYKISSEVPLAVWNKKIIAENICICFGYQWEELEKFSATLFYSKAFLWGPERSHLVMPVYADPYKIEQELKNSGNTVGFYSTGGWIRRKLGHIDQERDIETNEIIVLNTLVDYCRKENKRLLIFLHPREKAAENFESTRNYYQEKFKDVDYEFANLHQNTSELFASVNLAVAFTSTVVFERLYFGFKTLIMPVGFKDFPLQESPIENICARSQTILYEKIQIAMEQSTKEFFDINKLNNYSIYKRN